MVGGVSHILGEGSRLAGIIRGLGTDSDIFCGPKGKKLIKSSKNKGLQFEIPGN